MLIRATQKLLKNSKNFELAPVETQAENILSEWYADIMSSTFPGKMLIIFLHTPSNITIITEGKTLKKCYPIFLERLKNLMTRFSFPQKFIDDYYVNLHEFTLTKTNSKRVNGYFNGVKSNIDAHLFEALSYENIDFTYLENALMNALYNNENKKYFSPTLFWNAFFNGEEMPDYSEKNTLNTIVQLVEDHTKLSKVEDLYMENEIMKVEIEQRLGGVFATNSEESIDPEIENMFLKQIMAFDNNKENFIKTTPANLIGNVNFPPSSELSPAQLSKQLDRLIKKLYKVNINVDFLANYTELVKYNFLRDELIHEEIEHLDIPGMIHGFIYEEFHPNHDFDIRNIFKVFYYFLESDADDISSLKHIMQKNILFNNEKYNLEEFAQKIRYYKLSNNFIATMHYFIENISIELYNSEALVSGYIKEHLKKRVHFDVKLFYNDEFWRISEVYFN